MNHAPLRRAAATFFAAAALTAGLIASSSSMAASGSFDNRMDAFITHIKADPSYKRIPLASTADRQWFSTLSESLYQGKITKEQFVAEGVAKFPGYDASFATVADFMTAR